jgi:hypothetical protein
MRPALVVACLAALVAASSGVRASSAAFTAKAGNPANTFATAADWVGPAVTITAPADGSSTNDRTPTMRGAAGTATGDATTVTVRIYSGTTASGTAVQTRTVTRSGSSWTFTATSLSPGTYTARATQSDSAGNPGTADSTFTIDTTAPTPVSISAANKSGGVKGRLGTGDTIMYTFSEAIAPATVLSTFTGGSTAANVQVRFTNSGSADSFRVLDASGNQNVKLDAGVATNAELVTGTVTWPATMTQSSDGTSFTITLGTAPTSGLATTTNAAKNMVWTAKAGPTDSAGNALSISGAITETDNDQDF